MSNNSIGSLLGAGVGFLVGGPAGAKWGFSIGGILAGIVAPEKIKGPRLSDATRQTSMEGIPIPWGYGTFPTTGNIIWASELTEHENEEGGKGGPVTITYTYTRSYAIGICEGPISGIQKIKRNGKLVYDISPTSTITGENAKFLEKCTIYLGDETQTVDPTIEAVVGVGNTGPYRGLAYIVMEDDDLTESQGAIAQYEFVVQMCGTVTPAEDYIASLVGPDNGFHYPFTEGGTSGADIIGGTPDVVYEPTYAAGAGGLTFDIQGGGTAGLCDVFDGTVTANWTIGITARLDSMTGTNTTGRGWLAGGISNHLFADCYWGIYWHNTAGQPRNRPTIVIQNGAGGGPTIMSATAVALGETVTILIRKTGATFQLLVNGVVKGSAACTGGAIATFGASSQLLIGSGNRNAASYGSNSTVKHLWGVTRAITDDEAMLANLFAGGPLPAGVYEVPDVPGTWVDQDGNFITTTLGTESISACQAVLSDIVDDLCLRSGLDVATEVDTSQLTDIVTGFKCATESGADVFIEALTMSHFFDRAEWDKKLRFPKRGGAVVAALTMDDVTFRDGPPIEQTRIQEPELLRKVNVLSIDPAADYNITKQSWERRAGTIKAVGEASVEIPEVVETDTAAQIAEIRGKIAWAETDKFGFGYSVKWSKLTPTDPITLTDRGGITHRIRLQDMEEELGAFTIREAIKDRASVYTSDAVGVVNDNGPGDTTPGVVGPTIFAAMNLPQMRTQDGAGLYVGMAGLLPGWGGAQLLMSVDLGVSYTAVLTVTVPTKMGWLTADLDAVGSASEPLSVLVHGGQLASATTAQVAQGVNYSAVETDHGTAGMIAEVLAYETATPTTANNYNLSVLTRAIKGTERDNHLEGDVFMDLATAYFLPIDADYAGQTLYFKAVGFGVSADAVAAVPVVYDPAYIVIDGGWLS